LNLGNSTAPVIADTAQGVTPVAVQLVKYALRPLRGAGWPALEAPLPGHFMPGVAMRSCHALLISMLA
jgi:hypothetical protein